MKIQDLPHNVFAEINLDDYENMWHIKRFVYPESVQVYFYSCNYESSLPYQFLGEFNLQAKIGDICRILVRAYIGHTFKNKDNMNIQIYNGFYMWEGQVTDKVLSDSSCRIGRHVKTVLFEKK